MAEVSNHAIESAIDPFPPAETIDSQIKDNVFSQGTLQTVPDCTFLKLHRCFARRHVCRCTRRKYVACIVGCRSLCLLSALSTQR